MTKMKMRKMKTAIWQLNFDAKNCSNEPIVAVVGHCLERVLLNSMNVQNYVDHTYEMMIDFDYYYQYQLVMNYYYFVAVVVVVDDN